MARRYFYDHDAEAIRTITIRWDDVLDAYDCRIGRVYQTLVGAPACIDRAVDSPEAYDNAARAALAFAHDEGAIGDFGSVTRPRRPGK